MMTKNLEHHFFSPVIESNCFKVSYIRYSALQCHLAAAFCFIIKIYFIVSKTLLLPMSKDMNMKIIKVHNIWSKLTVTGVSAKQSVESVHRVLGEI